MSFDSAYEFEKLNDRHLELIKENKKLNKKIEELQEQVNICQNNISDLRCKYIQSLEKEKQLLNECNSLYKLNDQLMERAKNK